MRKVLIVLTIIALTGCRASREARDLVRQKHAETYVLAKRLNDPDPKNQPTNDQKDVILKITAKDWESMDRILNNWKPSNGMKSIDDEGKVIITIPATTTIPTSTIP